MCRPSRQCHSEAASPVIHHTLSLAAAINIVMGRTFTTKLPGGKKGVRALWVGEEWGAATQYKSQQWEDYQALPCWQTASPGTSLARSCFAVNVSLSFPPPLSLSRSPSSVPTIRFARRHKPSYSGFPSM